MKRRAWAEEEQELMREFYPTLPAAEIARALRRGVSSIYGQAERMGLKKAAEFYSGPASGRLDGVKGGSTRFRPGQDAWNKGVRGITGTHPNSRRTQFKPGRHPSEAARYLPIGSTRVSKDGYLEVKTTDDHPVPTRRWVAVHRLVWEAANGPIPPRHIVVFRPGMRTNVGEEITADRLECITLAENMRRNTYHRYPKDIALAIQARGALNRRINRAQKQNHR